MTESDSINAIVQLCDELYAQYGLTPVMAAEIECYVELADESVQSMNQFWEPVDKAFKHEQLSIQRIEKERGLHQYEIITHIMPPIQLATTLTSIRAIIEKYAARLRVPASFAAKPYAERPSSGLHLHLHLADDEGLNAYHKTEEWTSDLLRWSLGGLIEKLPQQLSIFFPMMDDYARLEDADHVPKIFGWGVNNRYCALRIPADPNPYHKRIEHRVPCANADPSAAIAAMLSGVVYGIEQRIEPPAQEYGKKGRPMRDLVLTTIGE